MSEQYIVCTGAKVVRLKRGMSVQDVEVLLGVPEHMQLCECASNIKYLYRIKNGSAITNYTVLFNSGHVAYVAKTN
jgi:hypothetical protein